MFEYIKYMFNVSKKPLLIWIIAPGLYLMVIPFAFSSGSSLEEIMISKRIALEDTLGKNETILKVFGINDWEKIWTLEGILSSYFFNLFFPMLIAIATMVFLNKMSAKAEENGTFEFVAALPMSRTLIALIHSVVIVTFGVLLGQVWSHLVYLPLIFMGDSISQTLEYSSLMTAALQSSLGGVSVAALGYAAGAVSGQSSRLWLFGIGLLAFEWLSSILAGKMELFDWYHRHISSFGAYGDPYNDGIIFGDLSLVLIKIFIFLVIGLIGFNNRSLNLR